MSEEKLIFIIFIPLTFAEIRARSRFLLKQLNVFVNFIIEIIISKVSNVLYACQLSSLFRSYFGAGGIGGLVSLFFIRILKQSFQVRVCDQTPSFSKQGQKTKKRREVAMVIGKAQTRPSHDGMIV